MQGIYVSRNHFAWSNDQYLVKKLCVQSDMFALKWFSTEISVQNAVFDKLLNAFVSLPLPPMSIPRPKGKSISVLATSSCKFILVFQNWARIITMQRYTQFVTGRYARCVYLVFVFTMLIHWKLYNIAENRYCSRNWQNGREYRIPCSQTCPNFSREIRVQT